MTSKSREKSSGHCRRAASTTCSCTASGCSCFWVCCACRGGHSGSPWSLNSHARDPGFPLANWWPSAHGAHLLDCFVKLVKAAGSRGAGARGGWRSPVSPALTEGLSRVVLRREKGSALLHFSIRVPEGCRSGMEGIEAGLSTHACLGMLPPTCARGARPGVGLPVPGTSPWLSSLGLFRLFGSHLPGAFISACPQSFLPLFDFFSTLPLPSSCRHRSVSVAGYSVQLNFLFTVGWIRCYFSYCWFKTVVG